MKNAQDELQAMLDAGQDLPFRVEKYILQTIWPPEEGKKLETVATVRAWIGENLQHTAGSGVGPVHALDIALKRAVAAFFPKIEEIVLTGYAVKAENTGSNAPVLCTAKFRCGKNSWTSVAEHTNQDHAAWMAVLDGYMYGIMSAEEAHK